MLHFKAEELEQRGIPYQKNSQFLFQNRLFTKGPSFSKKAFETAVALGKSFLDAGVVCFLVESQDYVTLCRQRSYAG